jgi:hypothetical protein
MRETMKTKPTPLADSDRADKPTSSGFVGADGNGIPTPRLAKLTQNWLTDCEVRQHTPRTIDSRQAVLDKLAW